MKIRAEMVHQRTPLCPSEYQVDKVEMALTGVAPEELARFNEEYDAFQAAEQAMGDMTP